MRFSKSLKGLFGVAVAGALVVSCATKSDIGTTAEPLQLDESLSDPVSDDTSDASVFADLQKDSSLITPDVTEVAADDEQPFYSAVGGETLGRVAYALYSDRGSVASLVTKNPDIAARTKLVLGQRVYFDINNLRPHPMYLTKDLLERYPEQLAAGLSIAERDLVQVQAGETLQAISQRLYGTTRYWTEIYLLNRDKLAGFDKIAPGIEITVAKRDPVGISYAGASAAALPDGVSEAPVPDDVPVEAPAEEPLTADVMGSTSVAAEQALPPEVKAESRTEPAAEHPNVNATPQPLFSAAMADEDAPGFWNSTNLRRVIYVGLIFVIVLFAFYVTRPSKKQKFDMLDMTSSHTEGANRPKLSKENQDRHSIG